MTQDSQNESRQTPIAIVVNGPSSSGKSTLCKAGNCVDLHGNWLDERRRCETYRPDPNTRTRRGSSAYLRERNLR
jgi:hypothetical protein